MTYSRLVEEALVNTCLDKMRRFGPKIAVIGCGGGGCNSVNRLKSLGLSDVETIAINTDRCHLEMISADKKIFIGEHITKGFGTGGNPVLGEKCARDSYDEIMRAVADLDLAFITAGMGGGSGTGISPVVAEAARRAGALTVAIVTSPFSYERGRLEVAQQGIARLNQIAHCTIVLDNNKLLRLAPRLPIDRAFGVMDHLIADTMKGLSETLFETSMINIDFSDFHSVMSKGGMGTMMLSQSEDVKELVEESLSNPFLDVDLSEAEGALIHITGGPEMSLKEAYAVFQGITDRLPSARNIKFGARIDANEKSRMKKVIGIVTGVKPGSISGERFGRIVGDIRTPRIGAFA